MDSLTEEANYNAIGLFVCGIFPKPVEVVEMHSGCKPSHAVAIVKGL
jgi:hypothetical protein